VETAHKIGGDGLEAFGVAADVLLEQGQERHQCQTLLCCFWADALQHHLTIGAEGVADTVALAQSQGPANRLRHGGLKRSVRDDSASPSAESTGVGRKGEGRTAMGGPPWTHQR